MATMADLMALQEKKRLSLSRGEQLTGEVVSKSDFEVTLEIGAKSEGIISKKDFLPDRWADLKVGDKIEAYVASPENESGQVILTLFRQAGGDKRSAEQQKKWQKFIAAYDRQTTMTGKVVELNKGGMLVEVDKVRGFVPNSQIILKSFPNFSSGELAGQDIRLRVLEVDLGNNRLVFSAKGEPDEGGKESWSKVKVGENIKAKILAVAPFGLFVSADSLEGIIFATETSWDEVTNLLADYHVGQEIEGKVTGKDENLGRVMLSLRQMTEDPFTALAEKFQADDVVSGTVKEVTSAGVVVSLENNMEGLVPAAKVEAGNPYTVGQTTNFLVDNVDIRQRRINLVPFLTSTAGLIYK